MKTERVRRARHRRVVLTGIGVSAALHAVVFATLGFELPGEVGADGATRTERTPQTDPPALQIVQLREVTEIDPEVAASDRPVLTTPAPVDRPPDPPASSRSAPNPVPAASASAAPAPSTLERIAASSLTGSLTTRISFGNPGPLPGARSAVVASGSHTAGHDQGADEEDDEDGGFWQRLGDVWGKVPLGSGGGKICKPPVLGPGGALIPAPAPLPRPLTPSVIRKQ